MRVCSKHILFELSSRSASNDTVDSILRHLEVGRAKDLSAPRYCHHVQNRSLLLCCTQIQQQPPKCRRLLCRGEPQTQTHGLGSRFWFHVKPVFPSLPSTLLPVPETDSLPSRWSYPPNRPLVDSWESQGLAATPIPQGFGHCMCSELKYVECTKYVRVQARTRACERSVYVVRCPGWFIK
jgi:hypothetical protein